LLLAEKYLADRPLIDTAVIMSFGRQIFGRQIFGRQTFGQQTFGQQTFGQQTFGRQTFGQPTFGRQTLGRHVVDEAVDMVDTTVDGLTSLLSTKCQSAKWFSTKRGGTDGHYRQKLESECKTLRVGGQSWIGSNIFFSLFLSLNWNKD
jgi:hypothetical protein